MLCRMILIVATYLASCTGALAQNLCLTTVDLQRMFNTLQVIAEQRAPATSEQINQLNTINARYSRFSVDWTFRDSAQNLQVPNILAAYDATTGLIADLRVGRPMPLRLSMPRTELTLNRGLSELARLDCPPALGIPNQQTETTATPRTASTIKGAQRTGFTYSSRGIYAAITFCAVLALTVVAYITTELRQASLRNRYICDIAVDYALPAETPRPVIAAIEDISRGGLKIRVHKGDIPEQGSWVSLHFAGETQTIRIQWSNAHFFGGQFPHPYSAVALRQLLGSQRTLARATKKPKK